MSTRETMRSLLSIRYSSRAYSRVARLRPRPLHLFGTAVEFQIGYAQNAVRTEFPEALVEGLEPQQEFVKLEGLGQVVVGPVAFFFVSDATKRSQHQHGYGGLVGAQALANLKAVQAGQVDVQNHHVVVVVEGHRQAQLPIKGRIDPVPFFP